MAVLYHPDTVVYHTSLVCPLSLCYTELQDDDLRLSASRSP